MSARDDLPSKQKGFQLGIDDYMVKSIELGELLLRVRVQLMDTFWGIESETSLRVVDVYITKLRNKFSGCDGFEIITVWGLGYKAVLR